MAGPATPLDSELPVGLTSDKQKKKLEKELKTKQKGRHINIYGQREQAWLIGQELVKVQIFCIFQMVVSHWYIPLMLIELAAGVSQAGEKGAAAGGEGRKGEDQGGAEEGEVGEEECSSVQHEGKQCPGPASNGGLQVSLFHLCSIIKIFFLLLTILCIAGQAMTTLSLYF